MEIKFKYDSNKIYYYLLIFIAISLPLSMFTLSLSAILLTLNWIFEGNFKEKINILRQRKSILLLVSIYILHIVGLIYTTDFYYGFHDLRIKLPLLIFPLIIGTSKSLNFKQVKVLLLFYIAALFASSLVSLAVFFDLFNYEIIDIRNISILIPHIRFAILINIGIFSGLYLLIIQNKQLKKYEKYYLAFTILWLSIFLIILKSFTGILLLIIVGYGHLFYFITRIKNLKFKKGLKVSFFIIPIFILIYIIRSITIYYNIEKIDFSNLEKYTINGNTYQHCTDRYGFENGNYVWINICEKELKEEWFKRSELEYDGKDKKGQSIKYTLIRYLASKGLKKDSLGLSKLTEKDIKNIELGKANYIYGKRFSFYPRIYELIWEIDNYVHGGNPSGHSITQRIIYIKTGLLIFKDNFFIGTGTGDVKLSFNKKYEEISSNLSKKWRLRAHNQFITFMLTFGIIGFLWISFAVLYPIWLEKKWNNYFFVLIFSITMLCMINEDTLETHVGASMIAYFYSLFLLGYENHIKIKEIQ